MTVRKRGKVWWYDLGNHKYRGPLPEARTKHEAEQAEVKLKRDVFEGKHGKQFGTMLFAEFVGDPDYEQSQFGEGTFLEWAKNNKRSWNTIALEYASFWKRSGARRWAKSHL